MGPAFRLRLRELDGDPEPAPEAAEDPQALKMFQRAARLEPYDGDYLYILGRGLLRARRFSEAAAVCGKAVQLNRDEADYHYALGAAWWGLERYEDAEAAFRESVRLRPDDARSLNGLGCALTRLGRRRAAVAVFHEALHQGAPEADLRGNLGVVLWARTRTAGALRALQESVRLAPQDSDLQRNLAVALGALGRHEEALALFRKVAAARPADPEAHLDLAETLHALGRDADAQKAVDAALRLDAVSLATRPHFRELRDAQRLKQLREELARDHTKRYRDSLGSRLLFFALGHGVGGLGAARRSLASLLFMAGLAAIGYGAYRVVPLHINRYLLQDDMAAIAGAPVREDADILDRLMHAVEERGLAAHIGESNFEIRTRPKWRRIICRYEVPVPVLPGLVHTFRFHIETEKPYILDPAPIAF
jgi:Flp pilus assembly protein TadD